MNVIVKAATAAAIVAGGLAFAAPASAHTTAITTGCGADGQTTFVVASYHDDTEGETPTIAIDGTVYNLAPTSTAPSLSNATRVGTPYDGDGEYLFLVKSLNLAAGQHAVQTGGGNVAAMGAPINVSTPACGSMTLSSLQTLTGSLSSNFLVTKSAAFILTGSVPYAVTTAQRIQLFQALVKANTGPGRAFTAQATSQLLTASQGLLAPVVSLPVQLL